MWTADEDAKLLAYMNELGARVFSCDTKQVARRVRHLVLDQ